MTAASNLGASLICKKTLYVSEGTTEQLQRELRAYPILDDGRMGRPKMFYTFGSDDSGHHRGIEGMCLAQDGHIIAVGGSHQSGPGPAIFVFSPDGYLVHSSPLPFDTPSRISFGGKNLDRLYITGGDGCLYESASPYRGFQRASHHA